MTKIFLLVVVLLTLYWLFPFLLTAGMGIGVLKRKKSSEKIAFTFDDGPHPVYTPLLLDLLKKNNIIATFFVVGSNAEKYPQVIARMHSEGHLIGMHNYVHKSNWVMAPWTLRMHLKKTASIIEKITGDRPIYYRPPWGLMTLFDFLLMKQYKIVQWSVIADDWRSQGGSEKVKSTLLQKIIKGDVILLHDNGETVGADEDAPLNTIHALKEVFKELSRQGMAYARIDEL